MRQSGSARTCRLFLDRREYPPSAQMSKEIAGRVPAPGRLRTSVRLDRPRDGGPGQWICNSNSRKAFALS